MKTNPGFLAIALLMTASVLAQQPRYDGPYGPVMRPRDVWQPQPNPRTQPNTVLNVRSYEFSLSGDVVLIDTIQNGIRIRDKSKKNFMNLLLDSKCKIKADKKQFGKEQLALEELETGYQVKLLVRRADLRVVKMEVKKPKESNSKPGQPTK